MKQNETVKQNFSENFLNTFIDIAFGWLFSFLAYNFMRQTLQKHYCNDMTASKLINCAI